MNSSGTTFDVSRQSHVLGDLAAFAHCWALWAAGAALTCRPGDIVLVLAVAVLVPGWLVIRDRRGRNTRAVVTSEGLTLTTPGWRRGRVRSAGLRWDEVGRVRLDSRWALWPGTIGLRLEPLPRRDRFWTLRLPSRWTGIDVHAALAQHPLFLAALRAQVPEERWEEGLREFPSSRPSSRLRKQSVVSFLLCAAVMVAALLAVRGDLQGARRTEAALLIPSGMLGGAAVLLSLLSGTSSTNARALAASLAGHACFWPFWGFFAEIGILSRASLSALAGFGAGLLLGAAALAAHRSARPTMRRVGACYLLGLAGGVAGYLAYGGLPHRSVGMGHVPFHATPWTPSGDGFLIVEEQGPIPQSGRGVPTWVRWHLAGGDAGHRVLVPGSPRTKAVGQEGALCVVKGESPETEELWFLPRRSGPAVLCGAARGFDRFLTAPDGRCCAVLAVEVEGSERWRLCDLASGALDEMVLPPPPGRVEMIWPRGDRGFVLVSGPRPFLKRSLAAAGREDAEEAEVGASRARPATDAVDSYAVWFWSGRQEDAPRREWADSRPWWDWYAPSAQLELFAQIERHEGRSDGGEWLHLEFAHDAVVENPVPNPVTADPRPYRVAEEDDGLLFGRVLIVDRRTGSATRLRLGGPTCAIPERGLRGWSPDGQRLLLDCTGFRSPFDPASWRLPREAWVIDWVALVSVPPAPGGDPNASVPRATGP